MCAGLCPTYWITFGMLREIEMVPVLMAYARMRPPPCQFPSFCPPRGSLTPKRKEDTSRRRLRPHAKYGVNRPAGCWEIVDRTNKQSYSKTNTSQKQRNITNSWYNSGLQVTLTKVVWYCCSCWPLLTRRTREQFYKSHWLRVRVPILRRRPVLQKCYLTGVWT